MMLFMFLLFPIMLTYSLFVKDFSSMVKQRYVPALIGILVGALYSFIELLFFSAYYLAPYVFLYNYAYFLFFEVLIPCVLCFIILFFFIKKQKNRFMLLYFILLGFYTVYFPARLMNRNDVFDWYLILVKPILYVAMLYGMQNFITYLYKTICSYGAEGNTNTINKIFIFKVFLTFFLCVTVPPTIDVMHLFVFPAWIIIFLSIFYSLVATCGTTFIDKNRFVATVSKLKEILKPKNDLEQKEE